MLARQCGVLLVALFVLGGIARADEVLGIRAEKPATGRSVPTDKGFMVPYTAKIPATDVEFEMVPVPGGKFTMGSPEDETGRSENEGPRFQVEVEPFWMGKYEITWAEYKQYMNMYSVLKTFEVKNIRRVTDDNKADAITAPTELYDPSFTFEHGEDPRQPAATMTQFAAKQYTKWLSGITGHQYRLPSEAEWEYACRAGSTTAYHFGDDPEQLGDHAWYHGNSDETTHPVGLKKPNAWGLYDMHGNVAEWTLDQMLDDGYKRFEGKTLKAADAIVWPTKLWPRAIRGGSWDDDASRCRSAARMGSEDPDWKMEDPNIPLSPWWFTSDPSRGVGFRIIRPLHPLPKDQMDKYWEADVDEIKDDVENRLLEGRGALGIADAELPAAIQEVKSDN